MRISDWSSDVCSSDRDDPALLAGRPRERPQGPALRHAPRRGSRHVARPPRKPRRGAKDRTLPRLAARPPPQGSSPAPRRAVSSEDHTSELQSITRISYAAFCFIQNKSTLARLIENFSEPGNHRTYRHRDTT